MSWLSAELGRAKKRVMPIVKTLAVGAATAVGGPFAGAAAASGLAALTKPKPTPMPPQQVMATPGVVAFTQPEPVSVATMVGASPILTAAPASGPVYSPPTTVPAMPYDTFRGIMWEAYQKGRRGDVLT